MAANPLGLNAYELQLLAEAIRITNSRDEHVTPDTCQVCGGARCDNCRTCNRPNCKHPDHRRPR